MQEGQYAVTESYIDSMGLVASMETEPIEWRTKDRLLLKGWITLPTGAPRAVVCLVHGLGEHAGRYRHVATRFAEAGYALLAFDMRGHGHSEGLRGHTPSYSLMMADIAGYLACATDRFPHCPRVLYGHSFGGNLALNLMLRYHPEVAGALVTSPLLHPAFTPPAWKRMLLATASGLLPRLPLASGVEPGGLSQDPEVVHRYRADPLVHDRVSLRLGAALLKSGTYALKHAARLQRPVLLMHGEADPITSAAASKLFADRAGSTCRLRLWPGMLHELHNETARDLIISCLVEGLRDMTTG